MGEVKTVMALLPFSDAEWRGDVVVEMSEQCYTCRHWLGTNTCEAFSKGIPKAIWKGQCDHRKPYKGDGGKRYTPARAGKEE